MITLSNEWCWSRSATRFLGPLGPINRPDHHSSLNQHVLVEYMIILVLVFLPCTAASPNQSNTGRGNKNATIILATTAAVAIASKIKVGTGNKESSLKSDMWTNSTKHFKDGEGETVLENRHGDDFAVWGLLDQHSKNVVVCNVLKFLRPKEVATLVASKSPSFLIFTSSF